MLHGDCRLGNVLYGEEDSLPTLVDFEFASRGCGALDVATFMCGSMRVDARRALEMDMLCEYHSALCAQGVLDYSFESLVSDYRNAVLLCLVLPVLSGAQIEGRLMVG